MNSYATDIYLRRNTRIPPWIKKEQLLISGNDHLNGHRVCRIRIDDLHIAFGPSGHLFSGQSSVAYHQRLFPSDCVVAIKVAPAETVIYNHHYCPGCGHHACNQDRFSRDILSGKVYIFRCSNCGKEKEVILPTANRHFHRKGNHRGLKNRCSQGRKKRARQAWSFDRSYARHASAP